MVIIISEENNGNEKIAVGRMSVLKKMEGIDEAKVTNAEKEDVCDVD